MTISSKEAYFDAPEYLITELFKASRFWRTLERRWIKGNRRGSDRSCYEG
jgi:hypothetical protein